MKAQTNLLPTQPQTHTSGFHWKQWFLCADYSLTQQQLHMFYQLKDEANILFEGSNERWDLVRDLYEEYFGDNSGMKMGIKKAQLESNLVMVKERNLDQNLKRDGQSSQQQLKVKVADSNRKDNGLKDHYSGRKEWLKLGFQGQYPETDFRGGGVMSLQLILRFVKRNKQLVKEMQNDKGGFFFAITAINIAFFMKKYFHLADFLVPKKDKQVYCDRKALKNFCRVIVSQAESYEKMHEMFLRWFYKQKWLAEQRRNPEEQTLLHFNKLFEEFQHIVRMMFEGEDLEYWGEFEAIWSDL